MIRVIYEYAHADKSEWGDGEWQSEPDKIQGIDTDTGYDTLMVRNYIGAWCGYVGITEGHPLFEVPYNQCAVGCGEVWCSHSPESLLRAHGGITFSSFSKLDDTPEKGIRHIAVEGRPEHVWWVGFDCAHSRDFCPMMHAQMVKLGIRRGIRAVIGTVNTEEQTASVADMPADVFAVLHGDVYRNREYVESWVTYLAKQLKQCEPTP